MLLHKSYINVATAHILVYKKSVYEPPWPKWLVLYVDLNFQRTKKGTSGWSLVTPFSTQYFAQPRNILCDFQIDRTSSSWVFGRKTLKMGKISIFGQLQKSFVLGFLTRWGFLAWFEGTFLLVGNKYTLQCSQVEPQVPGRYRARNNQGRKNHFWQNRTLEIEKLKVWDRTTKLGRRLEARKTKSQPLL